MTTVNVSIALVRITRAALPYGRVKFELTAADLAGAIVVPQAEFVTCDVAGLGSVALMPNSDGTQGTRYAVTVLDSMGDEQWTGYATVPPSDCNLHDILSLVPPATVDDATAAAVLAQGAAAQTGQDRIATAQDRLQTGLDRVATGADRLASAASAASAAHIIAGSFDPAALPVARADGSALQNGDICFGSDGYTYARVGGAWVNQTAAAAASAAAAALSRTNAVTSETNAGASATAALAAKVAAEAARDSVNTTGKVFTSTALGIAGTSSGQSFAVLSGDLMSWVVYQNSAGVAVSLARSYTSLYYDTVLTNSARYSGAGPKYPLLTDAAGSVVLGYDSSTDKIFGNGIFTNAELDNGLAGHSQSEYVGIGTVFPIVLDKSGRPLLGYDTSLDKLVGITFKQYGLAAYSINHLLFYGESLSIGVNGAPALSTSQPYSDLMFSGGPAGTSATAGALVESTVETPVSGAVNFSTSSSIVRGGAATDRIVLGSSAGVGGTKIADLKKGTANYTAMLTHVSNGKGLNANYAVPAMCLVLGSNDIGAATTFASYRADVLQFQADMQTDIKAISSQGGNIPLLMSQVSYGAAANNGVCTAQLSLALSSDKFPLVTPLYHFPYSDGVHLTNVGYKWLGAYFGRAYDQLVNGEDVQWLKPLSATRRGTTIRIRFKVPTLPLVIDTTTLAATTDNGFKVTDAGGAVAISSVTIDGPDVVLALGATPGGATTVRYALDFRGTGLTVTNGASGNLRDSTSDVIPISGLDRRMYHVCPHFELSVTTLSE